MYTSTGGIVWGTEISAKIVEFTISDGNGGIIHKGVLEVVAIAIKVFEHYLGKL